MGDDRVVGHEQVAHRVEFVKRVGLVHIKRQAGGTGDAAIERHGVKGRRITERTERVRDERAFVHRPAIAVAGAGAAGGIALILADGESRGAELRDARGADAADVAGDDAGGIRINQPLVAIEAEIRRDRTRTREDDAAAARAAGRSAVQGDGIKLARRAAHGECTDAHGVDRDIARERHGRIHIHDRGGGKAGRKGGVIECHIDEAVRAIGHE